MPLYLSTKKPQYEVVWNERTKCCQRCDTLVRGYLQHNEQDDYQQQKRYTETKQQCSVGNIPGSADGHLLTY